MKSVLTLLLSAALIAFMVGCAKKPKVESETKPTTTTKGSTETQENTNKAGDNEGVNTEPSSRFAAIYFDFDKYNLRDDAKDDLKKNIDVMKKESDLKITVEGHCDERGTVEYNLALGERRAKSARDYMVSLGIKGDRISTISYGKERPKMMGHDEDSWAKNRRDEFVEK